MAPDPATTTAAPGWHAPDSYGALLAEIEARTGVKPPMTLLSFTLAGVQEFLVAARTTRDVWNGSFLIAYLTFRGTMAVIQELARLSGLSAEKMLPSSLIPDLGSQPLVRHALTGESPPDLAVASFPNSVLLLVPGTLEQGAALAGIAQQAVDTAWLDIVAACRERFAQHLPAGSFAADEWAYQTPRERVFEFYWSSVEAPANGDEFESLRQSQGLGDAFELNPYQALIEWSGRVLGSRKRLRDFEQIGQEGHRCSLCGARSALADYKTTPNDMYGRPDRTLTVTLDGVRGLHEYWDAVQHDGSLRHLFRPRERLCAVCIVRRLAPREYFDKQVGISDVVFPSSSSLATAFAVSSLLDHAEADPRVEAHVRRFAERVATLRTALNDTSAVPALPLHAAHAKGALLNGVDGDWYYPETYEEKHLATECGLEVDEASALLAREMADAGARTSPLLELRQALQKMDPPFSFEPSNYYALIAVDGDRMGDWISGRMDPGRFGPDMQRSLSHRLAAFASAIRKKFEGKLPGKVVYAGGDDLLAFVPRECALEALRLIDKTFRTHVVRPLGPRAAGQAQPRWDSGETIGMTVSMACVLARHNDPLSTVIERAHALLKETAKREYGRDAFVIYRTTGGRSAAGARIRPRTALGQEINLLHTLDCLHARMAEKVGGSDASGLSGGVVSSLDEVSDALRECPVEAQAAMLQYIGNRHFTPKPGLNETDEVAARLEFRALLEQFHEGLSGWLDGNPYNRAHPVKLREPYALGMAVDLLAAVRFLTREAR